MLKIFPSSLNLKNLVYLIILQTSILHLEEDFILFYFNLYFDLFICFNLHFKLIVLNYLIKAYNVRILQYIGPAIFKVVMLISLYQIIFFLNFKIVFHIYLNIHVSLEFYI